MQRIVNPGARRWATTGALFAVLLLPACSAFKPLGGGSSVPWANARGTENRSQLMQLTGQGYEVRPGDHLSKLAVRYGLTVSDLAAANGLAPPYIIYVGQILTIPDGDAAGPAAPPPAGPRYVVRQGDSLSAIADRYAVATVDLATTNGIEAPYPVYAGQTLSIPETTSAEVTPPATSARAAHAANRAPPPLSGQGFLWPVNGKVVAGFGIGDHGERRDGINIEARRGAPVFAAEDGVAVYAGDAIRAYGRMVLLRHDQGYVTTYAHNSTLLVAVGDVVRRGQVIARVGDTGDVSSAQLHFELRKGRTPIDPESVLVHDGQTTVASTQ